MSSWDRTAEIALLKGEVDALVAATYENERPLRGLAGLLDWRLRGALSRAVREGVVTGKTDEQVYHPFQWRDRVLHVLLVGCGYAETPGRRAASSVGSLQRARPQLAGLRLGRVGLSRSDWGGLADAEIQRQLKGIEVRVFT